MSRQFATMINAGLSLLRALTILADQTENNELRRILGAVKQGRRDRSQPVGRDGASTPTSSRR